MMDDKPQEISCIRHAIKRLSNALNRGSSTVTTRLRRQKSTTLDSIGNLPSKDAVPARSALRGSRWPAIPERRVSFYDMLPCPNLGPSFAFAVSLSTESAVRRGGLLLPAITDDDRNADDHSSEVEHNKEQPAMSLAGSQPVARHDSPVGPDSLQRSESMRGSRTPGSLPSNAERRRSCMDFTRATMQEVHPQHSRPSTQEQTSTADRLDNISHAYKAHVDRSISSMQGQGHDRRGRAYLHESLVEIQEALMQAMVDTTTTRPASTNEVETSRSHTRGHAQALRRRSEGDESNASNDKMDETVSSNKPYDSAQPSAETVHSTSASHLEVSTGRLHDVGTDDQCEEGLLLEPALMPPPLRIHSRHLRRDSMAFQ